MVTRSPARTPLRRREPRGSARRDEDRDHPEPVAERERAEMTLREAQDELIQAAKLAVLGQLATGITHELTQPLAALRTLSENAVEFMEMGDQETLAKNLGVIGDLVDRMARIIGPLKSFARKSPSVPQPGTSAAGRCSTETLMKCHSLSVASARKRIGRCRREESTASPGASQRASTERPIVKALRKWLELKKP